MRRHEAYVNAIEATGVIAVMGHFKNKSRGCHSCNATWIAHGEKETDVSSAIHMLYDAYKKGYEKAVLLTRDSDLVPAIRMIRAIVGREPCGSKAPLKGTRAGGAVRAPVRL